MLAFMVILWYISTTRYTLELGLTALMQRREVGANTTIGNNNAAIGLKIPIIPDKCKIMLDLYTILFVYSYMEKRGKMMSFG